MANYDARLERLEQKRDVVIERISEDQAKRMASEMWRRQVRAMQAGPLPRDFYDGIWDDLSGYCYTAYLEGY